MKSSKRQSKEYKKIVVMRTSRGLLIRRQDFVAIARAKYPGLNTNAETELMSHLTVSSVKYIGKRSYTKRIGLYKIVETSSVDYVLIARFADVIGQPLPGITLRHRDKIHSGIDITSEKLQPGVDLLENQQVAFDYMVQNVYSQQLVQNGRGSCIFILGTGLGKTYIGGAFIEMTKKKTLIIVQNTSPIEEWQKMLAVCFPNLVVGEYHSKAPKRDGDVVIMTISSALKDQFTWGKNKNEVKSWTEYFRQFGAIIFDEVHNYPTEGRHEIFWRTNFMYTLGLTATLGERSDNMDAVIEKHLGPVVRAEEIPGFDVEEIQWHGDVQAIRYSGPSEYTKKCVNRNGWVSTKGMCDQFISDPYRNQLVLSQIEQLYNSGKNIFVFSERCSYLRVLRATLREGGLVSEMPEDAQTLMGGVTASEEQNVREQARIILITYGYGTQSISIARMDAIIFATPRRNKMRQTLGRILRRNGNPEIRRDIIDIIDDETSLRSQFSTRKGVYLEKGFNINEIKMSYKDFAIES